MSWSSMMLFMLPFSMSSITEGKKNKRGSERTRPKTKRADKRTVHDDATLNDGAKGLDDVGVPQPCCQLDGGQEGFRGPRLAQDRSSAHAGKGREIKTRLPAPSGRLEAPEDTEASIEA